MTHRRSVVMLTVALALLACGGLVTSESDPSSARAPDAGIGDARSSRPDREEDDAPPALSSSVPAGWELHGDYRQACGFYVPSTRDVLPKPIAWESCGLALGAAGAPGPPGMVCKRMVTDWEPSADGYHLGSVATAARGPNGELRMAFARVVGTSGVHVVADVDGPVHQAILRTGPCWIEFPSLSRTHVVYEVFNELGARTGGAIGGRIGDLRPTVLRPYRYLEGTYKRFVAGDGVFVEDREVDEVLDFDGGAVAGSIDQGSIKYVASGRDFFFERLKKVMSWTFSDGTRTLLGEGNDGTMASTGFGTDGVDMVWLEASEQISSAQFAKQETWTAKYTTDPKVAQATKRRVRATEPVYGNDYEVGCGYAATRTNTGALWGQHGIRVTRLSDGVSWAIVDNSAEQMMEWSLTKPIALTCDEVFVLGSSKSGYEIMRLRLDSLGPGTQPT